MKCDLYRFFPWVWVPFPRNCPEGAGFYLELEKGLRKIVFHNFFMIIEYIYHLNLNNF